MNEQKRHWRAAAVFGMLTVATAFWFAARPMPACGVPIASAMLDFELATARPQFAAVLDCVPRRLELDRQNIVDLLLFMWVYTGFLASFMLAARVRRAVAIGLAVAILGSDLIETVALRRIAAGWPELDATSVVVLAVAAPAKFVAIGLAMIAGASKLWRTGRRAARVVAGVATIGGLASVAIVSAATRGPASLILVVGWLAILAYAVVSALRAPPPAPSSVGA